PTLEPRALDQPVMCILRRQLALLEYTFHPCGLCGCMANAGVHIGRLDNHTLSTSETCGAGGTCFVVRNHHHTGKAGGGGNGLNFNTVPIVDTCSLVQTMGDHRL